MSGYRKNVLILCIIAIIVGATTEYFKIPAFLFPLLVFSVAVWLFVSPFKLDENE